MAVLPLVAGCGGQDEKDKREAEAAGRHMAAESATPTPSPTPPPPRRIDCARLKCLALTFDDGPGEYSAQLLDHLGEADARATFYLLGRKVGEYRDVVRRMALEGHEVANHTWSHPDLTGLPSSEVRSQVRRTQRAIEEATGVVPETFRPPYGATDARVGKAVGMPQILWSTDSMDWRHRNARRSAEVGVNKPGRGGIVLFHGIHESTVKAVPEIVTGLRRRGFTLVTVTELLRSKRLEPGKVYRKLG